MAAHELGLITDFETLGEMLTFVYDEQWRPAAEEGEHDDLVMALAIAHRIRVQQSYKSEAPERVSRWTASMQEDYDNASEEERRYLLERWGRPEA